MVALLRYGAGIINWKVDELKKMDRTTSDIARLYLKRKHGGRGLITIEMCMISEKNNLSLYVSGSNEMLLKGIKKSLLSKVKFLWTKKSSKKKKMA